LPLLLLPNDDLHVNLSRSGGNATVACKKWRPLEQVHADLAEHLLGSPQAVCTAGALWLLHTAGHLSGTALRPSALAA